VFKKGAEGMPDASLSIHDTRTKENSVQCRQNTLVKEEEEEERTADTYAVTQTLSLQQLK
jgi:hypothetical protein